VLIAPNRVLATMQAKANQPDTRNPRAAVIANIGAEPLSGYGLGPGPTFFDGPLTQIKSSWSGNRLFFDKSDVVNRNLIFCATLK
jgi:hypothetical protein